MIKNVFKRDGETIVPFDVEKIVAAITAANNEVKTMGSPDFLSEKQICEIADYIMMTDGPNITVSAIQNMVENQIMKAQKYDVARAYITYRYRRDLVRRSNSTDDSILSLLNDKNDEVARENSNKRAVLNSTKRDLVAGEVSKDLTNRVLLPKHIVEAHERGTIHFHDRDYFMMPEFNCCLPNFRDMLENGTSIHGVAVETPKSFRVACNQITQIMADIASNQYGGQTFYSDVLGKYLAFTKEKFEKRIRNTVQSAYPDATGEQKEKLDDLIRDMIDEEIKIELKAGIQCIQYQINTLMTTNGQSPFVTVFMYLRDDDPYIEENALIIEEILKQRLEGIKSKEGDYTTPEFPKLIYVLSENNCLKGGKYDYLTHLAAKCSAKRMYPDYISEKIMKEQYDGEVFGCMGCVSGDSTILFRMENIEEKSKIVNGKDTFENLWKLLSRKFEVKEQIPGNKDYLYMDLTGFWVWDTKEGFVEVKRIIKNFSEDWVKVTLENGFEIDVTPDHLFDTENRGNVTANCLTEFDEIAVADISEDANYRWMKTLEDYVSEVGLLSDTIPMDFYKKAARMTWGVTKIKSIFEYSKRSTFSYDLTTTSEHFEVNNIYSHNCRSFLGPWKDPETGEYKWEGRLTSTVGPTLNDVNARKSGVITLSYC